MGNKNSGLKNYTVPFDLRKEESQYWLGYICADGNIQNSSKYRIYKVSLASKDKEIIDKFILFMGDRCKYHLQKQNNMHIAYVNSKQLCEYMINKLNITSKKALLLNPKISLTRHFIRGYFDGDGSIRKNKKESKITSGSSIFIARLSRKLNDLKIYHKIRTKGNAQDICIERTKENKKFLEYMYKNSSIYLDRKFNQYVALTSDSKC